MIRHASEAVTAKAIPPLAIAMIESPFRGLLVTPVSATSLAHPCEPPTGETAIALTAITAGTDKKLGAASDIAANSWSETVVRHAPSPGGTGQWLAFVSG